MVDDVCQCATELNTSWLSFKDLTVAANPCNLWLQNGHLQLQTYTAALCKGNFSSQMQGQFCSGKINFVATKLTPAFAATNICKWVCKKKTWSFNTTLQFCSWICCFRFCSCKNRWQFYCWFTFLICFLYVCLFLFFCAYKFCCSKSADVYWYFAAINFCNYNSNCSNGCQ